MTLDLDELEARAHGAESVSMPGVFWCVQVNGDELLELVQRARALQESEREATPED